MNWAALVKEHVGSEPCQCDETMGRLAVGDALGVMRLWAAMAVGGMSLSDLRLWAGWLWSDALGLMR